MRPIWLRSIKLNVVEHWTNKHKIVTFETCCLSNCSESVAVAVVVFPLHSNSYIYYNLRLKSRKWHNRLISFVVAAAIMLETCICHFTSAFFLLIFRLHSIFFTSIVGRVTISFERQLDTRVRRSESRNGRKLNGISYALKHNASFIFRYEIKK